MLSNFIKLVNLVRINNKDVVIIEVWKFFFLLNH